MSINQFIGYEMAAREACRVGDFQTLKVINERMAAAGMQFVLEDDQLLLKLVGQCEEMVA